MSRKTLTDLAFSVKKHIFVGIKPNKRLLTFQ